MTGPVHKAAADGGEAPFTPPPRMVPSDFASESGTRQPNIVVNRITFG